MGAGSRAGGGVGEPEGGSSSIDELVAAQDVEGLIELGAAFGEGAGEVSKDLFKAVECFEAASRFGSAEAEYRVGLAFMSGLGVSEDLAEGAKRMRSAAQRGSLPAKVYVANLYEMGVHYAADRDKADVWYRNVARAAEIGEPDGDAHELAMAELGCVRFCLQIVADEELPTKDRAHYLKKAKAMGYGHRLALAKGPAAPEPEESASPEAEVPSEESAESAPEESAKSAPEESEKTESEETESEETEEEKEEVLLGGSWTLGSGLLASVASAVFGVSSYFAGWLAAEGSQALAAMGRALPGIGSMHDVVFGVVIVILGVAPAAALYRAKVMGIGVIVGVGAAAAGWYVHAGQPLLWSSAAQAGAFGLAGFWVVLLFLGLLGGTRARPPQP